MNGVIIHGNVVLHGITLAENAEIKNMQVEQLSEDPVIEPIQPISENIENTPE